jgi:hypothetical protein
MSKKQGHDYSTILIWSAAVVTVVRYVAAFIASDMGEITGKLSEAITVMMGLSGLGMGILDVIGGTYLFDGWRRKMPATGKKWSFAFKVMTILIFSLMATGVMILVPFTVSRVTHASMEGVLGMGGRLTFWAFLVNVAPYLLIGGVAVGNQVVTVNSPETSRQVTESSAESNGKFPVSWRQVRKQLSDEDVSWLRTARTEEICFRYGVNDRTARNWRGYAQKEQ